MADEKRIVPDSKAYEIVVDLSLVVIATSMREALDLAGEIALENMEVRQLGPAGLRRRESLIPAGLLGPGPRADVLRNRR